MDLKQEVFTMTINEFLKQIEGSYNKHFTKSKCFARYANNLYRSIGIKCYLAGDNKENSGNYWDNDMFNIGFSITLDTGEFTKDTTPETDIPNNLELKAWHKTYFTKPENKYNVYGSNTLKFRKTVGDPKKIIKTLDVFFAKLKEELIKEIDLNNIHENYLELLKTKI
jgi:hypothetical protein